jgi:hypothetical protein
MPINRMGLLVRLRVLKFAFPLAVANENAFSFAFASAKMLSQSGDYPTGTLREQSLFYPNSLGGCYIYDLPLCDC